MCFKQDLKMPSLPEHTLISRFHFRNTVLLRVGLSLIAVSCRNSVDHHIGVRLRRSYKSHRRDVCGTKNTKLERISRFGHHVGRVPNLPIALGQIKETSHVVFCLLSTYCRAMSCSFCDYSHLALVLEIVPVKSNDNKRNVDMKKPSRVRELGM